MRLNADVFGCLNDFETDSPDHNVCCIWFDLFFKFRIHKASPASAFAAWSAR